MSDRNIESIGIDEMAGCLEAFVHAMSGVNDGYDAFEEKIKGWSLKKLIQEYDARVEEDSYPRLLIFKEMVGRVERRVIKDIGCFVCSPEEIPKYLRPAFRQFADSLIRDPITFVE